MLRQSSEEDGGEVGAVGRIDGQKGLVASSSR